MSRQKLFRTPYLNNAGGDLSKAWFIELGFRDPQSGKMVRKRYYDGFAVLRTKKARIELGNRLIKELTEKLLRGWIPLDDIEKVAYVDELEYHQAAQVYGRRRETNKNIRFYASEYITLIKNTKAKKTFESYRGKIRELIAWLEKNKLIDNDLSTFDSNVLHRFFDHLIIERSLAGVTIEKYKINIQGFFTYLVERKVLVNNPVPKIEIPETSEDFAAVPFADDDMKLILSIIRDRDPQLYLAAMLQYFCFVRPGEELLTLRVKQINLVNHTIFIPKDVAKKRRERTMDIPDQLYELLIEHGIERLNKEMFVIGPLGRPGVDQIGMNTLRNRFNTVRDQLKMNTQYKWYSFKHSGAGKLLESGATIVEVMNQLGHTDIASTYRYIRRHFGERSEHVRTKFPDPSGGMHKPDKIICNWLEGISLN